MPGQKEYWDKKISEWSYASYGKKKNVGLIEKIATYFRSVDARKEIALKLVGSKANNKIVMDIGCGLGEFTFSLLMRFKPKKIIAYDISEIAIKNAKKNARDLKVIEKIDFRLADIASLKELPAFDLAVGLGFIDYLKPQQLKHLFNLIGNRPFLFSYFEKKLSLFNLMHKMYITLQKCPGAYKYKRSEIRSFMPKNNKLYFIKKDGLQFITNYRQFSKI